MWIFLQILCSVKYLYGSFIICMFVFTHFYASNIYLGKHSENNWRREWDLVKKEPTHKYKLAQPQGSETGKRLEQPTKKTIICEIWILLIASRSWNFFYIMWASDKQSHSNVWLIITSTPRDIRGHYSLDQLMPPVSRSS